MSSSVFELEAAALAGPAVDGLAVAGLAESGAVGSGAAADGRADMGRVVGGWPGSRHGASGISGEDGGITRLVDGLLVVERAALFSPRLMLQGWPLAVAHVARSDVA